MKITFQVHCQQQNTRCYVIEKNFCCALRRVRLLPALFGNSCELKLPPRLLYAQAIDEKKNPPEERIITVIVAIHMCVVVFAQKLCTGRT